MPLYAFECKTCGKPQEAYFTIANRPPAIPCECGAQARRVMMIGAVQGDDMPPWMRHPDTLGCLQNSAERKVRTRSEFNKYVKEHNILVKSVNREI